MLTEADFELRVHPHRSARSVKVEGKFPKYKKSLQETENDRSAHYSAKIFATEKSHNHRFFLP